MRLLSQYFNDGLISLPPNQVDKQGPIFCPKLNINTVKDVSSFHLPQLIKKKTLLHLLDKLVTAHQIVNL